MKPDYDKIVSAVVDESQNMSYVSDPETYEILFLNKAMRKLLGVEGRDYEGQLCYQLLQGLEKPCPFCTNKLLSKENYYMWTHYNERLGKYFQLQDKFVEIDDKTLRMEIAVDVTDREKANLNLKRQLSIEETLVRCIHTLSSTLDMNEAIQQLLTIIGEFYQADRAYIFELNQSPVSFSNTYEWCKAGVVPQIHNLQNLPLEYVEEWVKSFEENGQYCWSEAINKPQSEADRIMMAQGVERMMITPLYDGGELTGFIGVDDPSRGIEHIGLLQSVTYFIQNDISKRFLLHKLQNQSYVDALTGLGNRNKYIETIEGLKKQNPSSLGVVFVDINDLKKANDNYGHEYGDMIITNLAEGLKKEFPEYAFRVGGDEFVALYIDGEGEEFDRRVTALRRYQEKESICDFSMGASYDVGNVNVEAQINRSDYMMYAEKQAYYNDVVRSRKSHYQTMAKRIQKDISEGLFVVRLQPQVYVTGGRLYGAEAVVRKVNVDGSVSMPEGFVSLYETEGVIPYLDMFVYREACRIQQSWKEQGLRSVPIAVNFSRLSLVGKNIAEELRQIREEYDVAPGMIRVEVTESISGVDAPILRQLLREFAANGFEVSLDDFGAEYCNLALLTQVDFNEIKLDRSLIINLEHSEKARTVVRHVIDMCRSLKEPVCVAEGIENEEQRNILREFACDVGQGFLFSPPIDVEKFVDKYYEELKG